MARRERREEHRERVAERERGELKGTAYEIFIGILSVLSILNLVFIEAFGGNEDLIYVLYAINALLSGIFFGDFCYRLFTAHSRSGYFFRQYGWADLLASLPFPQTKVLRLFRLLRVYRLLVALGPKEVVLGLRRDLAGSALLVLLLMAILVLEFGSLGILAIEDDAPGANITTASDAIWYVICTISTVGYGDTYPVTNAGRLVGTMIIVVGVGIFGTLSGYLANLFLSTPRDDGPADPTGAPAGDSTADDSTPGAPAAAEAAAPASVAGAGIDGQVRDRLAELQSQLESQQRTMRDLSRLVGTTPPSAS